jgi:hypothetical protein
MAANHPDYPVTASSLGERLIEKDLSLSLPARRSAELQRR